MARERTGSGRGGSAQAASKKALGARGKKAKPPAKAAKGGAASKSASPKRATYEQFHFVAPGGTRTFYREAAWLEGMPLEAFMREAIHAHVLRVLRKHGKTCDPPLIHPERPPPLSPNR